MTALLERMATSEGRFALVLDADNRVTGTVSSSDVQRAVSKAWAGIHRPPECRRWAVPAGEFHTLRTTKHSVQSAVRLTIHSAW